MGNPPITIQRLNSLNELISSLTESTAERFDALDELISRVLAPGVLSLLPFLPADLPSGWYHANGDQFPVSSKQGIVLLGLSANYKSNWNITVTDSYINVPNLYNTDGRGFFLRAGSSPGTVQGDTIRNLSGNSMVIGIQVAGSTPTGPFTTSVTNTGLSFGSNSDSTHNRARSVFNASLQVPTSTENRPLNRSATPAVYLGVVN
jgi:hypothetical protein